MRAEPRGDPAGSPTTRAAARARIAIEPVARLRLERRGPGCTTSSRRAGRARGEPHLVRPRRVARTVDRIPPPARGAPRAPARAQRELVDAVAGEARVRVAVDEPGIADSPRPSISSTSPSRRREVRHGTDCGDAAVLAQHVRPSMTSMAPRSGPRRGARGPPGGAAAERDRGSGASATLRRRGVTAGAAAGSDGRSSPCRRAATALPRIRRPRGA